MWCCTAAAACLSPDCHREPNTRARPCARGRVCVLCLFCRRGRPYPHVVPAPPPKGTPEAPPAAATAPGCPRPLPPAPQLASPCTALRLHAVNQGPGHTSLHYIRATYVYVSQGIAGAQLLGWPREGGSGPTSLVSNKADIAGTFKPRARLNARQEWVGTSHSHVDCDNQSSAAGQKKREGRQSRTKCMAACPGLVRRRCNTRSAVCVLESTGR